MADRFPETNKETYLCDGVFVSFDGYQIALRNSTPTSTTIYLEPNVWLALGTWLARYPTLQKHMGGVP